MWSVVWRVEVGYKLSLEYGRCMVCHGVLFIDSGMEYRERSMDKVRSRHITDITIYIDIYIKQKL